jgi:[acyl-carrier-protein] S-malonyltransferase
MPCRWCAFARRPCRRRCRWVGAMAAILGLDAEVGVSPVRSRPPRVARWSRQPTSTTRSRRDRRHQGRRGPAPASAEGPRRQARLPLAVSAPFHSSLMKPAAERLRSACWAWRCAAPRSRWSTTSTWRSRPTRRIRDALYRQAFGPVRWVEVVQALKARGATHIVECGPGKVLAGMVKRIDASLVVGLRASTRRRWPKRRGCCNERNRPAARWRW